MSMGDSIEREIIFGWHDRAQIDHSEYFIRVYIAYNAWYKRVTGYDNDFEAMSALRKRFLIWDEYAQGETLLLLRPVVDKIVILTQVRPNVFNEKGSSSISGWNGQVTDRNDWKGLIAFWYGVRCKLIHGSWLPAHSFEMVLVQLAYESLNIFMTEIIHRMRDSFDGDTVMHPDRYITAPPIWEVDMVSVRKE